MESLAYIHISLEYEKALQAECNLEQLGCQKTTNTPARVYCWQTNLSRLLPQR